MSALRAFAFRPRRPRLYRAPGRPPSHVRCVLTHHLHYEAKNRTAGIMTAVCHWWLAHQCLTLPGKSRLNPEHRAAELRWLRVHPTTRCGTGILPVRTQAGSLCHRLWDEL